MPEILESLTLKAERIDERAFLEFELDSDIPAGDGLLDLSLCRLDSETEFADTHVITDIFNTMHIGDGLPVIPPTQERYRQMMSYSPYEPDEIIAENIGPSGQDICILMSITLQYKLKTEASYPCGRTVLQEPIPFRSPGHPKT